MRHLLALLAGLAATQAADNSPQPEFETLDARELHNLGTRRLADQDIAGAEDALRAALARDQDALRPGSLHNLGHVRFNRGRAALGGKTKGDVTDLSIARSYVEAADADISDITDMIGFLDREKAAKREPDYNGAVSALSSGIDTYRTMKKQSIPAADKQLTHRGGVIAAWVRSVGDFRGAHELAADDTDARANADRIEELLRNLRRETEALQEAQAEQRRKLEELRAAIIELLKRIPPEKRPANAQGEGEDDDFGQGKPQPQGGGNRQSEEGSEGKMSEQEARGTLEGLKDELGRKMSTTQGAGGAGAGGKPGEKKGKDY